MRPPTTLFPQPAKRAGPPWVDSGRARRIKRRNANCRSWREANASEGQFGIRLRDASASSAGCARAGAVGRYGRSKHKGSCDAGDAGGVYQPEADVYHCPASETLDALAVDFKRVAVDIWGLLFFRRPHIRRRSSGVVLDNPPRKPASSSPPRQSSASMTVNTRVVLLRSARSSEPKSILASQ